jgi:hypothetical protein
VAPLKGLGGGKAFTTEILNDDNAEKAAIAIVDEIFIPTIQTTAAGQTDVSVFLYNLMVKNTNTGKLTPLTLSVYLSCYSKKQYRY